MKPAFASIIIGLLVIAACGQPMEKSTAAAGATPWALFTGRVISGVGAVLFNVVLTKMVADWFAGREIVTAMALTAATWPLGSTP